MNSISIRLMSRLSHFCRFVITLLHTSLYTVPQIASYSTLESFGHLVVIKLNIYCSVYQRTVLQSNSILRQSFHYPHSQTWGKLIKISCHGYRVFTVHSLRGVALATSITIMAKCNADRAAAFRIGKEPLYE